MNNPIRGFIHMFTGTLMILLLWVLLANSLQAQSGGNTVVITKTAPSTVLNFYDGSNNLEYVCRTPYPATKSTFSIAASTLTSIVVSSNTGTVTIPSHGLAVGNAITVTGTTGDTDLNDTWIVQTVTNANVFTITTANVSDATYNNAAMVVTTTAPRSSAPVWQISKYSYTSTYRIREQNSRPNQICDNRATSTGATKIAYE